MGAFIKSFEVKEKYLLIVAQGVRKNFLEVVKGTAEFTEIIKETKSKKVLLDYRLVTFNVHQSDAYKTVKYYEQLPILSQTTIAALINTETLPLARIWKEVSLQRGFSLDYFLEFHTAEQWLLSQ